ncbi:MAG TPA: SPOR domain-containing protein [Gaiellaceae bacterium]|nr:SPOR domain-containing protein [Gaiellaceae bacterium]
MPSSPANLAWPQDRRGWTIVLLSLPQSAGRAAAEQRAAEARRRGLRNVGVLDSSRFASLHPGYFVVFTGVFDSQAEAASALQRARAAFPTAYQREIVP